MGLGRQKPASGVASKVAGAALLPSARLVRRVASGTLPPEPAAKGPAQAPETPSSVSSGGLTLMSTAGGRHPSSVSEPDSAEDVIIALVLAAGSTSALTAKATGIAHDLKPQQYSPDTVNEILRTARVFRQYCNKEDSFI